MVADNEMGVLEQAPPDPEPPQIFSRVFSVPPGLPWVQMTAARLEVRHGAPLPIADLAHQLRRIGGWSFGQPAKFVVFYVRSKDYVRPFETSVLVDGRSYRVGFGLGNERLERARDLGGLIALGVVSLVLVAVGISLSLAARSETETQISNLERQLLLKTHAYNAQQKRRALAQQLQRSLDGEQPVEDVMADLSWASSFRAPDAKILAVHWDHGLLAVESRGDSSPFAATDRNVERSERPIRSNVWLWGVHQAQSAEGIGP